MKKKRLILYYIILMLICPVCAVSALSDGQKNVIVDHCDKIHESLKKIQQNDARTRVYLGTYYEKILSKYLTPLNLKLVENNISNASLIENQNKFAKAKTGFNDDFINYQKDLEDLVSVDCKKEPSAFYEKLVEVRKKREVMVQDIEKLNSLISEQKNLVIKLKDSL